MIMVDGSDYFMSKTVVTANPRVCSFQGFQVQGKIERQRVTLIISEFYLIRTFTIFSTVTGC